MYFAGAYIGYHFHSYIEYEKNENKSFNVLEWIIILSFIVLFCTVGNDTVKMLIRYTCLIPVIYLFRKQKIVTPKSIMRIGMYLYCSHDLVFRVLRNIISIMNFNMIMSWGLLILLSAAVIWLSWRILQKYMPLTLRILTGNRC